MLSVFSQNSQLYTNYFLLKIGIFCKYSEIPVGREVLNCQHRWDNVLASRKNVLQRYEAFVKWRLVKKIQFSDNYTMPPLSRPQILHGIQWKQCSGLTLKFCYYLRRSRRGHICAKNTCAVNLVWCILLNFQTNSNCSICFRTGSAFHEASWRQSAVIKRTYRDINVNYITWWWSFYTFSSRFYHKPWFINKKHLKVCLRHILG